MARKMQNAALRIQSFKICFFYALYMIAFSLHGYN